MSGAAARTRNVEAANTADPQAQIDQLATQIEELSSSHSRAQSRRAELSSERETLILAARVNKDAASQQRIREIDEELLRLSHDIADDGAAIEALSGQAEELRRAQIKAAWEAERSAVRAIVAAQLAPQRAARIQKLASELAAALKEAKADDEAAYRSLVAFDRSFAKSRITVLERIRARVLSVKFVGLLCIDPYEMGTKAHLTSIEQQTRLVYEPALQSLDDLELVF